MRLQHLQRPRKAVIFIHVGNNQGLLMLINPPGEGLFGRELGNCQTFPRRVETLEVDFVELLIVYTGTQEIEAHHRAQFADENIKESLRTVARNQGLRNPQKRFVALGHRPESRGLDTGIHCCKSPITT